MARAKPSGASGKTGGPKRELSLKAPAKKAPGSKPIRRSTRTAAVVPSALPRGSVPTRWIKAIAGVLLLPVCWVAGKTFWKAIQRATVHGHLLASPELGWFAAGVAVWTVIFFASPKMVVVYVFGHELTHAIWVLAQGGTVSAFRVTREGGYIIADRRDFLVSLAPYFFPIYSIFAIIAYGIAGWIWPVVWSYPKYLFFAIGLTWAFHFTFTCWMIPKKQTDLLLHGTFFSLVIIYLANLVVLAILFVVACPQVTWRGLGTSFVRNAEDFSDWACERVGVHPHEWLTQPRRHHR